MNLLEKLELIKRVDGLIKRKATGTPEELAKRLGTSRKTVYNLINLMKKMKAPIVYCQKSRTFYYEYAVNFSLDFVISDDSTNSITGGMSSKNLELFSMCKIFTQTDFTLPHETFLGIFSKPFDRGA